MLNRLYVKNVALISEADIVFDCGLNVLSGETGSGKSVILDSINFVLGCKADRTMIRFGEKEALVRAEFSVATESEVARKLVDDLDIETDGNIIISRRLSIDGKSSIKINGNTVTSSMLKNITQHLVDVHGQSEHFFLLSEENQLKVIDGLLGDRVADIKEQLNTLISDKKKYKSRIASLGGDEAERARRLDLLEYQIKEIENAELKIGEFEQLRTRRELILNVEKILTVINYVVETLNGDSGCVDGLTSAVREMNRISHINEDYAKVCSRLEDINTEAVDIAETLSDMAETLNFDEREVQAIEERLRIINVLKKKYGADEEQILSFLANAKNEFDAISDSAVIIDRIFKEIEVCNKNIFDLCKQLTLLRKSAAKVFCENVVNELKTLNIPYAQFNVNFNDYNEADVDLSSVNGCDKISFEFSANKGEPLKPLNKVISGGEMSRFMLAVKTQLRNTNGILTYIFDEIDAGISGFTAARVASKFREISKFTQILAVSHLPQVCAASDFQFLIYKVEEDGKTLTKVKKLTESEKIDELVRLTGSINSDTARQHAKELIDKIK